MKTFEQFVENYLEYSGMNSSWSARGTTIHLKDILKYLDEKKVPIQLVNPNKIKNLLIKAERNPKRVEDADLEHPLIITMVNGKYTSLLDGNHRLVKALKKEIDKIKIRVLDIDSSPNEYKKLFNR